MKRFLLFSFTSVSAWVLVVGCSSSGGGGGGSAPCDDAGLCQGGLVCQNGQCVQPGTGGSGQGGSGTGGVGTGGVGTGGVGTGGTGNVGTGGFGGVPSGGSGGLPSGGSGGLPSGGTGGTGGGDCEGCLSTYCGTEINNCNANPDCASLINCIASCTDQPCVDSCASSYPNGVDDVIAIQDCGNSNCSLECA